MELTQNWNASALNEPLEAIAQVLRGARRVLLTMHAWPDGDALGSTLGLAASLRAAGVDALVYNPSPVPPDLTFLPGANRVVHSLGPSERFDAIVACDAGHPSRLGADLPGPDRRGTLINLDHHVTTPRFGDLNWIDPSASAVGVLVHRIIRHMGLPLPLEAAVPLYTSLVTDTGSFRYSNTDPETHRIAAELIQLGVRPWDVTCALYENQDPSRIQLLGLVLPTLERVLEGKVACLTVTAAACQAAGTAEETAEGFVVYPRSIAGVEVAVLFREELGRPWRVSLRSRGRVDVSAVARAFGGGGHQAAAGCEVAGTSDEVRRQLFVALEEALRG
jgi:phosphoesterase RecJ-like protein